MTPPMLKRVPAIRCCCSPQQVRPRLRSLRSCCEARTRRCVSSNASLQEAWTPFPGEPHQVGQDTANWTTEKLVEYLGQHTGVLVTEETVRVYLHAYEYGGLASDLDFAAQGRRESCLCGKRLRVEVLLASATAPEPLPVKA